MEVILNKTVDNLGLEGDIVNVKPGYARNFLIPQQLAMPVTKQNIAILKHQKEAIEARLEKERKAAEQLAGKLNGVTVEISRRVGEEDRLFGSVTSADIAEKLAELSIPVDKRNIVISEPIKSIGESKINVKVGFQMTAEITVQVIAEAHGD